MKVDEGGNPKVTRPWTMEKGSSRLICHLRDKHQIKSFTALQFYVVIAAALACFFDVFYAFGVVLLSRKHLVVWREKLRKERGSKEKSERRRRSGGKGEKY